MGNKNEINWDLPAVDTFKFQKMVYGVSDEKYKYNIKRLSEMLRVEHLLNIPLRNLSLGERMKMEIINSFLYSPEIVFLDEPTIALDLNSQIAIRKFIREYRKENNTTIIITSHYMDDIEETCDRVILLSKGCKLFDGNIKEITESFSKEKILQLKFSESVKVDDLAQFGEIIGFEDNTIKILIDKDNYFTIVTEVMKSYKNLVDISLTDIPFKKLVNKIMNEEAI